jgi:hypothetical protein
VTGSDLKDGLDSVLAATPALGPLTLPLLLEKVEAEEVDV